MLGTTHVKITHSPTLSHKDMAVGTKNRKFELIRTKDRFPSCFFDQAGLFLLVWFLCSNSTMKAWFMQSPLNCWCVCYLNSEAFIWAAIWGAVNSDELIICSRGNFLSCGSPHESQFHHRAWLFLRLHLKKLSKFLTFSVLTVHVLKYWWTVVSLRLFELFLT